MHRVVVSLFVLRLTLSAQLVTDETLRLDTLHAIFPAMPISHLLPNAAGEPLYAVEGRFTNQTEDCASVDINIEDHADTREVALKLFRWPAEPDSFVALVQYRFLDANPPMACPSIAILSHLIRSVPWRVTNQYLFETMHHFSIRSAEMRTPFLFIESDEGGAGTGLVTMHIFDLSERTFREVLRTYTRLVRETEERYTQTLDIPRTTKAAGREFCFTKNVEIENGISLHPPKITHPCYPTRPLNR